MRQTLAPLTLGTAGHVDHGKTALVEALTGVDTDRLPQERARGMSIELGYAVLELSSGRRLSIVDVPGHERFIATMVAGAAGIDCHLMVVAADEGVRRQTREHAQILDALGVQAGVAAIAKVDLADPGAAIAQTRELLGDIPIVPCSARSGSGLEELMAALDKATRDIAGRSAREGPAVMHIDRSFSIAGAGTVVTGTLCSGAIAVGDTLTLHPRATEARVRSLQVHGEARERVAAGQRVAVNLARVRRAEVTRGDVLAARGAVAASHFLDVRLDFAPRPGATGHAGERPWRVQAHHGTRATAARAAVLEEPRMVQLRCQTPLFARVGDRLAIRDAARRATLGGAVVIDPLARRHGPEGGRVLTAAATASNISQRGERSRVRGAADAATGGRPAGTVIEEAGGAGEGDRDARSAPLSPTAIELARRLRGERFSPTPDSLLDAEELARLCTAGLAVRLVHGRHAHVEAVAGAARSVRAIVAAEGYVSLPRLRDELGVSRRDAKAFLDHFDGKGMTLRRPDDTRILRGTSRR
jgi:selenocysteine-specific elongation factor